MEEMKITTSGKADETPDATAVAGTPQGDTATAVAGTPPGDTSAGASVAAPRREMSAPRREMSAPRPQTAWPPAAAGTSTARQVRTVILVTLLTALLLDSSGFVRTGQGTPSELGRTLILAVGTPVDDVARALHLGGPKHWLDAALGHPDFTAGGGGMENGPALPSRPPGTPALARRGGLGQRGVANGRRGRQAGAIGRAHALPAASPHQE